jgi:endogenous inhibitor of DNA gyrase (YacG/DUF329 family)
MMTAATVKKVPCPNCKTPTPWSENNSHRPFCSESCRNKDFIAWANEEKVMKGNSVYDDILSDDLQTDSGF